MIEWEPNTAAGRAIVDSLVGIENCGEGGK